MILLAIIYQFNISNRCLWSFYSSYAIWTGRKWVRIKVSLQTKILFTRTLNMYVQVWRNFLVFSSFPLSLLNIQWYCTKSMYLSVRLSLSLVLWFSRSVPLAQTRTWQRSFHTSLKLLYKYGRCIRKHGQMGSEFYPDSLQVTVNEFFSCSK